jgi:hypothetical protein
MKKNLHNIDRIIRIAMALVVGILFSKGIIAGVLGITLSLVSVVFVLTSLISYCPLYHLLGISTLKTERK